MVVCTISFRLENKPSRRQEQTLNLLVLFCLILAKIKKDEKSVSIKDP